MKLIRDASSMIAALRSIASSHRSYELAAQKRDAEAFKELARARALTQNNRFASWDVELQLLEAYLLLEGGRPQAAQSSLSGVFSRIKSSTYHNPDEQAVLIRHGVSVLWLARGRAEPSCLLAIRQHRKFDASKVRTIILKRFPNPDVAD